MINVKLFRLVFVVLVSGTIFSSLARATDEETLGSPAETKSKSIIKDNNTAIDIDGNIYKTITIGNQIWMAENLKVTHFRNGDPILNASINESIHKLKAGSFSNYNHDKKIVPIFGRLYNWYAVDDIKGLAPEGWHIPTEAEWKILIDYLGGYRAAGGKMKEAGATHWKNPNKRATDESGFSAVPAGYRYYWRTFSVMGNLASFWTATEFNYPYAVGYILKYNSSHVISYTFSRSYGLSVRCIRD
jgi:uncharacterized protein (TIGR02145 family)